MQRIRCWQGVSRPAHPAGAMREPGPPFLRPSSVGGIQGDGKQSGHVGSWPNPMRRFGRPEEVTALVTLLLLGKAGFIDATVITVDGGQFCEY